MSKVLFIPLQLSLGAAVCLSASPIFAQVTSDGTVNTQVNQNGNVAEITGGETRGGNLFHSFQDFSVPSSNEALFDNANNISNIFSRVTGGNISNIDGAIRANGSASLFLINPAGILFGENASLDLGGSFYGSTADSILFEGGEFSAVDNLAQPLLTVNAPIGLSFRDNPAEITNSSVAENVGLQVLTGQKINLFGGNLNLTGGKITAPGGVINLGGLSTAGTINIEQDGNLSFPDNVAKANVQLSDNAVVDVTSDGGGLIVVNADNLDLTGASLFLAGIGEDLGSDSAVAGTIQINTTSIFADNESQIRADNLGTGQAGTVNINTDTLDFNNNSAIVVSTFGQGNSGIVNITAQDISFEQEWGGIYNTVGVKRVATDDPVFTAVGNGGEININTDTLELTNGARISANRVSQGDAGNINISATGEVSFSGQGDTLVPAFNNAPANSGASTQVQFEGEGNAGNITITADSLNLSDQGSVFVDNSGLEGDAGDITLDIQNNISLDQGALIDAQVQEDVVGNAGDINITANSYESSGSFILADNQGIGDGGNVNIDIGETISLNEDSLIQTELGEKAVGNAGGITITANSLILNSSSDIISRTEGQGNGGDIQITAADSIEIANNSVIQANTSEQSTGNAGNIILEAGNTFSISDESRVLSQIQDQAEGNAGDITINANSLTINNGNILSQTLGQGNAGDITIDATESIFLDNNSSIENSVDNNPNVEESSSNLEILNNSAVGDAGDITITTKELTLNNNSGLNNNSFARGDAGNITVNASGRVFLDGGSKFSSDVIDPSNGGFDAVGNAGTINIKAQEVALNDNSNFQSLTSGQGNAGNVIINAADNVTVNGNFAGITSQVTGEGVGDGGDIEITAGDSITLSDQSILSANASEQGIGNAGSVSLNADNIFVSESLVLSQIQDTAEGNAGGIEITADTIDISNFSLVSTNAGEGTLGEAGNINLKGTNISINNGSVVDALTENGFDGGNIGISGDNLEIVSGGVVVTSAASAGNAGNINLNLTGDITINGEETIARPESVFQLTEQVLNDLQESTGLFAASSAASTGSGGNIKVINGGDITISNNGVISVDSQGEGDGGILTVNTNSLNLDNQATISAITASGDGGDINLTVDDTISLQNNSIISTQALDNGNGGNINIDTDFIVAFPNQNNDIVANAQEGQGGNIEITAESILGIVERDSDPPNNTNDIDASSEFGLNGTVSIFTPDTNTLEGTVDLPSNIVEPKQTTTQACNADRELASQNNLTIKGRGGVRSAPDLPLESQSISINGEFSNSTSTLSEPIETSQGKVQPARGIKVTESGAIILTAYPTNNAGERLSEIKLNCG